MYIGEIINTEERILEMFQDRYYLLTRSQSEFIRIWCINTLEESMILDNEVEVLSMALSSCFIVTCDIMYEIR